VPSIGHLGGGAKLYFDSLPPKPYCKGEQGRMLIRPKNQAIRYPLVQLNHPALIRWLVFDIDATDAQTRAEDRGCPEPTFIALNRANGHAHLAYWLDVPVYIAGVKSAKSAAFYEDVKRGLTHRLGADSNYCGLLAKNPLWEGWAVQWLATRPYELATLNDSLEPNNKRPRKQPEVGEGRNAFLFDALSKWAVKTCLSMKHKGMCEEIFRERVLSECLKMNALLPKPLCQSEVKGIAKSVSKWTWKEFTLEKLSAIQSHRAKIRWAKRERESASEPWIALGVCRRTWERRRNSG